MKKDELRPCIIDGKADALFHCWGQEREMCRGVDLAVTVGIVEFKDGSVRKVDPKRIRFVSEKVSPTLSLNIPPKIADAVLKGITLDLKER